MKKLLFFCCHITVDCIMYTPQMYISKFFFEFLVKKALHNPVV